MIVHEDTFFSVELPSLEAKTHPILPFSLPVCHRIIRHCFHFYLFQQTEQLYGISISVLIHWILHLFWLVILIDWKCDLLVVRQRYEIEILKA